MIGLFNYKAESFVFHLAKNSYICFLNCDSKKFLSWNISSFHIFLCIFFVATVDDGLSTNPMLFIQSLEQIDSSLLIFNSLLYSRHVWYEFEL